MLSFNNANMIQLYIKMLLVAVLACWVSDSSAQVKRIAIQGQVGSFHDVASHEFFSGEDIELICCATFEDVFAEMKKDSNVIALLAIENTIAGSLLHNYELLNESGVTVVGEQKLRISHSIACLPEEDWNDIKVVNSHPVALMQCREFLKRHPRFKAMNADDTAGAAKMISEQKLRGHAAICAKYAAKFYGLKVLEEAIETDKHNFTRFLVLSSPWQAERFVKPEETNKATVMFQFAHGVDSLSQVLRIFADHKVKLSKIQTLPIIGREWEYRVFVDVSFDDYQRYCKSIAKVRKLTSEIKILGEYKAR